MSAWQDEAGPARRRWLQLRLGRLGRPLRVLGILCIAAALGVGGYTAWLLWGTGLATARAQAELRPQIQRVIDTRNPSSPGADRVRVPGDAIGILLIPKIHLDMVVVEGTDTESLKKGPGHYTGTAYPWDDHGRVAIAGHRTTYLHPFYHLDALAPGDRITIETEYGTFQYVVTRTAITPPSDGSVLDQTPYPSLVLTTCNPRYSAAQRLIVFARRLH